MSGEQFDEDYYMNGIKTGKSLYSSYSWKPELTIPMVQAIINHLGIYRHDTILDFGCARGYVVRALREIGYTAYGHDISLWALENADGRAYQYLSRTEEVAFGLEPDWIIAKDVLEHIFDVANTITKLMDNATKGVFVVVPLAAFDNGRYVVEDYELDITHIHRLALPSWTAMFMRPGWSVEARYRLCGVKDNYGQYPDGNGFITARRVGG